MEAPAIGRTPLGRYSVLRRFCCQRQYGASNDDERCHRKPKAYRSQDKHSRFSRNLASAVQRVRGSLNRRAL